MEFLPEGASSEEQWLQGTGGRRVPSMARGDGWSCGLRLTRPGWRDRTERELWPEELD